MTKGNQQQNHVQATAVPVERAFLVGVDTDRATSEFELKDSLAELAQLADTAGALILGSIQQKLEHPTPAYYIGRGKVEELVRLKGELGFNLVIFDDELRPVQLRNLEQELGVKVIDRTALILDIFSRRAHTHEGRLQVEL
ncbi:MAG: GTPase HflX, partial [Dehalococcoidia bacterium]|nr:GTPase HflX [Dehalococcoidia bacterium]